MIRVLLADDHKIVLQGIRALLNIEQDIRVLAEAATGLQALQLLDQLHPDVLVMDYMMPGLSAVELIRQARQRHPALKIIVLSMHANEAYVVEALRNGASGYVLKEATVEELVQAIRTVVGGRQFLSAPISQGVLDAYLLKASQSSVSDPYETLTDRERQVFNLVVEGYNTNEIAGMLFLSPRTVETHRYNLMHKLGVQNQAELLRYAIRRGLVSRGS